MKAENNEVEFEMDDLIIRDSLNEKAHLNIALIIVSIVIIVFSFTYMIYEPVISNHEKSYPFQPTHPLNRERMKAEEMFKKIFTGDPVVHHKSGKGRVAYKTDKGTSPKSVTILFGDTRKTFYVAPIGDQKHIKELQTQ